MRLIDAPTTEFGRIVECNNKPHLALYNLARLMTDLKQLQCLQKAFTLDHMSKKSKVSQEAPTDEDATGSCYVV